MAAALRIVQFVTPACASLRSGKECSPRFVFLGEWLIEARTRRLQMKTSKWLAAVGVLTLTASLAVAAPHEGKGEGQHGKGGISERMAQKLNLTDAQKAQVKTLHENFRAQNK